MFNAYRVANMGVLDFLFGRSATVASSDIRLEADGSFSFEIVGESFYQNSIARIAGPKCEDGYELEVEAALVPEDDNKHDENAVGVWIERRKVGHLPRAEAKKYRRNLGNRRAVCSAMIVGGWLRERRDGTTDEGHYGVRLDIA